MTTLRNPIAPILLPDEQLLGGCKAAGHNAVYRAAIQATTTGLAGPTAAVSANAARAGARVGADVARSVPQDRVFWFAVTNQRLVFFRVGAMSFTSKPKAVASTIALGAIAGVQITKGKIFYKVEFDFRDGSATTIDLYRANSPTSASDALCSVLPHTLR